MAQLSTLSDEIDAQARALEEIMTETGRISSTALQAAALRDRLRPAMDRLRAACDEAETILPCAEWPFPSYAALLFSV